MSEKDWAAPELLAAWRDATGTTQTAGAAALDVRQGTWSDWEARKKRPHIPQALGIAQLTGGCVPVEAWTMTMAELKEAGLLKPMPEREPESGETEGAKEPAA